MVCPRNGTAVLQGLNGVEFAQGVRSFSSELDFRGTGMLRLPIWNRKKGVLGDIWSTADKALRKQY